MGKPDGNMPLENLDIGGMILNGSERMWMGGCG
jgi:hypothetical protein